MREQWKSRIKVKKKGKYELLQYSYVFFHSNEEEQIDVKMKTEATKAKVKENKRIVKFRNFIKYSNSDIKWDKISKLISTPSEVYKGSPEITLSLPIKSTKHLDDSTASFLCSVWHRHDTSLTSPTNRFVFVDVDMRAQTGKKSLEIFNV